MTITTTITNNSKIKTTIKCKTQLLYAFPQQGSGGQWTVDAMTIIGGSEQTPKSSTALRCRTEHSDASSIVSSSRALARSDGVCAESCELADELNPPARDRSSSPATRFAGLQPAHTARADRRTLLQPRCPTSSTTTSTPLRRFPRPPQRRRRSTSSPRPRRRAPGSSSEPPVDDDDDDEDDDDDDDGEAALARMAAACRATMN